MNAKKHQSIVLINQSRNFQKTLIRQLEKNRDAIKALLENNATQLAHAKAARDFCTKRLFALLPKGKAVEVAGGTLTLAQDESVIRKVVTNNPHGTELRYTIHPV